MTALVSRLWGSHAHFIRSLGLRSVPGAADGVLVGILPIKLKQVLQVMDPITVTWFRLLVSGGCLFIYLASVKRLPSRKVLGPRAAGWC